MRKSTPLVTLVTAQVAACALALWFYFGPRAHLLEDYTAKRMLLSTGAAIALSSWLIPLLCAASSLVALWGFLGNHKPGTRLRYIAAGVTVLGLGFAAAALAAIAPSLR